MKDAKIAVVGAGSIGLYYGGKLAAGGHDVSFLLRTGYEEAQRDGIRIHSPGSGDVHLSHPRVFRTTEEIGPVDLALIAVKVTANPALETLLPPLLGPGTMLLTLQNGLGNEDFLAERFGGGRVLGGLCFICLTRRTAAQVDHIGAGLVSIGEYGRPLQSRTRDLVAALERSGVEAKGVDNLAEERWRKLLWNIPFNGLAVAEGGLTVDRILADPALHAECRGLMEEVRAIAAAAGHEIEPEYVDFQIDRTYPMGAYQPSTLIDWLAGNELEIEPIWGEPLSAARRLDVPAPRLERLHGRLNEIAEKCS